MSFLQILLQTAPAAPAGGGGFMSGGMSSFVMIGLVIVVFYFFMMRPQMKKQKEQASFLNEIGKGTKIVTIGGICGKVLEVRGKSFLIEVEGGNRLQIIKSAISLENSKVFNAETADDKEVEKKD
ncbi:MAG: preprotein translocase subunit YajC [Bacteroidota bacterium]|nr:preprotein translocase subunit YajC [Bacteroidota bacterium]